MRPSDQNRFWQNLRVGRSTAHKAVRRDLIIIGLLMFGVGLLWFSPFGRGLLAGALLMFILVRTWPDLNAWLTLETVWERYGPPPRNIGKHAPSPERKPTSVHNGKHPRPGARNQA